MFKTPRAAGFPRFLHSALVAVSLLAGCAPSPPAHPAEPQPPAGVDQWLGYLTAEEKVGQLFWVGVPVPGLPTGTVRCWRRASSAA